jgi:hypothetical protein
MAKTHKPNDEEKIVKENVQKRFKNMFSGENEPPATMSIKEVDALAASRAGGATGGPARDAAWQQNRSIHCDTNCTVFVKAIRQRPF